MTGSTDSTTRVAIITGAGGGLGGAVAALLAEAGGYRLSLVDNRADALAPVVDDLRARGVDAESLVADLGAATEAESVVPRPSGARRHGMGRRRGGASGGAPWEDGNV
jgi:NADP-dependent 3-hydroxy acid dehydrogenase YdfG